MRNKIFRIAFPLARGWASTTTVRIRKRMLHGVLLAFALPLLLAIQPANAASFNWTVTGPVGPLIGADAGQTDVEGLAGAQIILSIIVDEGVYQDLFGLAFAPIASGGITILGSADIDNDGVPGDNDGIHALTIFPSSPGTHFGYYPGFPSVFDNAFWPLSSTLPSGNILTLAHGFYPDDLTWTGWAAVPGGQILLSDFATGMSTANYTVAAQEPEAPDYHVISQYESQDATYTVVEIPDQEPIPEPTTMLLIGTGLVGLAGFRRKFRRKE